MGEIYSGSCLTLYAAAGESADSGLASERDPLIRKPTAVTISAEAENWVFEELMLFREFNESREESSPVPLFERGWVLQEEILASRCLIFHRDEMAWKCLSGEVSESKPGFGFGWSHNIGYTFHKLQLCLRNRTALDGERRWPESHHRHSVLDEWYKMLGAYSRRSLTHHEDVIDSTTGVSSIIQRLYGHTFLAGLWLEDLQLGLLWRVRNDDMGLAQDMDFVSLLSTASSAAWSVFSSLLGHIPAQ
jgi:hypothetical protein